MNKILVTGGCGFLGSYVCEYFQLQGWKVVAYDNLTKFEYSRAGFKDAVRDYNLNYLKGLDIPVIVADVRDLPTLQKAAKGIDFIAHCAAQPAMTVALESPLLDFYNNVQGTLNVLEAAKEAGAAVINCSTIHMYGNENINDSLDVEGNRFIRGLSPRGIDETHSLLEGVVTPLHVSKRAAELYVQTYTESYLLPAATFRLTGIYGPRQFGGEDHGWIANFAIRALLGQPIKVFGTDKQVRDILYVSDAAKAFHMWYKAGCPYGTFNIGGGPPTATSIKELLAFLEAHVGKKIKSELLDARKGDLWWFVSNSSKAHHDFGWSATTLPGIGLQRLIDWIETERSLFE